VFHKMRCAHPSRAWAVAGGTGTKKLVSFNLATSTGGGSGVKSFSYGYFAAGVDPAPTFLPDHGLHARYLVPSRREMHTGRAFYSKGRR
jgi:hypothetical protein